MSKDMIGDPNNDPEPEGMENSLERGLIAERARVMVVRFRDGVMLVCQTNGTMKTIGFNRKLRVSKPMIIEIRSGISSPDETKSLLYEFYRFYPWLSPGEDDDLEMDGDMISACVPAKPKVAEQYWQYLRDRKAVEEAIVHKEEEDLRAQALKRLLQDVSGSENVFILDEETK